MPQATIGTAVKIYVTSVGVVSRELLKHCTLYAN